MGGVVGVDGGECAQDARARAEGDERGIRADIRDNRIQLAPCIRENLVLVVGLGFDAGRVCKRVGERIQVWEFKEVPSLHMVRVSVPDTTTSCGGNRRVNNVHVQVASDEAIT